MAQTTGQDSPATRTARMATYPTFATQDRRNPFPYKYAGLPVGPHRYDSVPSAKANSPTAPKPRMKAKTVKIKKRMTRRK